MEEGRGRARVVRALVLPLKKSEPDETSPASLKLLVSPRRKVEGERKDGGEMGSWPPKTGVPARDGRLAERDAPAPAPASGVDDRASLAREGVVNILIAAF